GRSVGRPDSGELVAPGGDQPAIVREIEPENASLMGIDRLDRAAALHVPQPDRAILAGRSEYARIIAKSDRRDARLVAAQGVHLVSALCLPDVEVPRAVGRCQEISIRAVRDGGDPVSVFFDRMLRLRAA